MCLINSPPTPMELLFSSSSIQPSIDLKANGKVSRMRSHKDLYQGHHGGGTDFIKKGTQCHHCPKQNIVLYHVPPSLWGPLTSTVTCACVHVSLHHLFYQPYLISIINTNERLHWCNMCIPPLITRQSILTLFAPDLPGRIHKEWSSHNKNIWHTPSLYSHCGKEACMASMHRDFHRWQGESGLSSYNVTHLFHQWNQTICFRWKKLKHHYITNEDWPVRMLQTTR